MYGLGGQMGMRPGNARMMRPHNALMNPGLTMAHRMAQGGSTAPLSYADWAALPTQAKIDRVFPPDKRTLFGRGLDAVRPYLSGASPAAAAPVAAPPVVAAPAAAPVVPVAPAAGLSYAHGGGVQRFDDGGSVGSTPGGSPSGFSPLMQTMLQGYQQSQAQRSPFAPAQPNPAAPGAPGAAPMAPKPFTLPGGGAGGPSMVPQRPIQPGLMQRPQAVPPTPAVPTGAPIVPFMNPGNASSYAGGGPISGPGGGHDDLIDAKLSDGEFVIPADVVSHLGDGSNKTGAEKLDGMLTAVRAHKATGTKFPPKAKGALDYVKGGKQIEQKAQGGLAGVRTDYSPASSSSTVTGNSDATMTGVRG
jgi:hypothetical protein